MTRTALAALAFSLALPAAAANTPAGAGAPNLDRAYDLAPGATFSLRIDAGDASLSPSPDARAHVRVTLAKDADPASLEWKEAATGPSAVTLELRDRASSDAGEGFWTRLFSGHVHSSRSLIDRVDVQLPKGAVTSVASGVGDLVATGLPGASTLRSGAGDVKVTGAEGDVNIESGTGDVHVEGVTGRLEVKTGAGDLDLQSNGDAIARTGTGEVRISSTGANVSAKAGAGDVSVTTGANLTSLEAETGVGDVSAELEGGGSVQARSGVGDIKLTAAGSTEEASGPGAKIDRRLGDGTARIELHTGAGDVSVRSGAPAALAVQ